MTAKRASKSVKGKRQKPKPSLKIVHRFDPNSDPHGDIKLRALMIVMGHSEDEIERVIEERQIKRANQADRSEG